MQVDLIQARLVEEIDHLASEHVVAVIRYRDWEWEWDREWELPERW